MERDGVGEETEEDAELKDEELDTTKEATEDDDNPGQSRSADPDVDSSSALSKHPERFISKKREDKRSLRYVKVLQVLHSNPVARIKRPLWTFLQITETSIVDVRYVQYQRFVHHAFNVQYQRFVHHAFNVS